MLDGHGGTGIILGGEDIEDPVAPSLDIAKRPATIVVGKDGTLDALWHERVPLPVVYAFLSKAYGLRRPS